MAEIKVSYAELQEKNIDLDKLLSSSELETRLNKCYLVKSEGKFARASNEKFTAKTSELTRAFRLLIKNTITFLNTTGVVFEEADNNAASRVDKVTK